MNLQKRCFCETPQRKRSTIFQHFYPSKVFYVRTMETMSEDWENVKKTFQGQLLMIVILRERNTKDIDKETNSGQGGDKETGEKPLEQVEARVWCSEPISTIFKHFCQTLAYSILHIKLLHGLLLIVKWIRQINGFLLVVDLIR